MAKKRKTTKKSKSIKNEYSNYLLAIVAIIAVVGIVLMVNNGNCTFTTDANEINIVDDLAGEAHGRDDNDRNDDDRDRKLETPDSRDDPFVTIPLGGSDEKKGESSIIPPKVDDLHDNLKSSRPEFIEKFPKSIIVDIPPFVEVPEGNGLVPECIPKIKCETTITLVLTDEMNCTTETDCNDVETCKKELQIGVKCGKGKGCPEWLDLSKYENPQEMVDKWCDNCIFLSEETGNEICDTEEQCDETQSCEPKYEPIETTECSWVC